MYSLSSSGLYSLSSSGMDKLALSSDMESLSSSSDLSSSSELLSSSVLSTASLSMVFPFSVDDGGGGDDVDDVVAMVNPKVVTVCLTGSCRVGALARHSQHFIQL